MAACLRALPAGTRPLTQTASEAPSDTGLTANATAVGAVAGVVVTWAAADLLTAEVRAVVGLPEHPRWVSRTVTFAPADQVPERERALGLVIASIVEQGFAPRVDRAPPRGREPPVPEPSGAESPAVAVAKATPSPNTTRPEDGDHPGRWAVEAGLTTAYESGTDADDTKGGTLAVRRFVLPSVSLRVGAAFRLNERDQPDVTGLALIGQLGAGWSGPRFGPGGRFEAGARADFLMQQQSVRVSLVTGDRSYWSTGVDALAEFGVGLARGTMLLAAAGLEEMFTEADVVVNGRDVATLRHGRLVLQIGVLSRF